MTHCKLRLFLQEAQNIDTLNALSFVLLHIGQGMSIKVNDYKFTHSRMKSIKKLKEKFHISIEIITQGRKNKMTSVDIKGDVENANNCKISIRKQLEDSERRNKSPERKSDTHFLGNSHNPIEIP